MIQNAQVLMKLGGFTAKSSTFGIHDLGTHQFNCNSVAGHKNGLSEETYIIDLMEVYAPALR
jgi:hypothetical protein